jgi:hypothetical protein
MDTYRSIAQQFAASRDTSLAVSFSMLAGGGPTPVTVGEAYLASTVVDPERLNASLAVLATLDRMRAQSDREMIVEELRRERDLARWREGIRRESTGVRARPDVAAARGRASVG